ncbi:MAG: Crp/Fnr family transcriptional regulator [Trichocoleus desertorum ATA4-8-CV12]|jgi:CRP-like cAMP-binding protein|nr:Crp/Fnr family transcriptional regulator [Trichocoleus desertorum ATA4-8-CV12]
MSISLLSRTQSASTNPRQFAPRSLLPLEAESLWKIETGVVRALSWLEDGTVVTLGLWGAGEIVGKALAQIDPYQLECLTKVEATRLHIENWQETQAALLAHIQQAGELTLIRSHRRVDMMLLKLLNWLGKKFGRQVEQGQLIDLRLTHQDIADILGSTRVTITRTLNQLEQQGLIRRLSLQRIVLQEEEVWHYEI